MKTTVLTCDCGCGAEAPEEETRRWFLLSQSALTSSEGSHDDPKIVGMLHFQNPECLKKWAENACRAIPKLQELAQQLHPRGSLRDENVLGLYV